MPNNRHNPKKKANHSLIKEIKNGHSVSLDFFKQNAWFMVFFIVAVLALIVLRYSTQSKMVSAQKLEILLAQAENDKIAKKAKYMSLIRETEMRKLLHSKNIDLDFQEQPPYRISLSDNSKKQ